MVPGFSPPPCKKILRAPLSRGRWRRQRNCKMSERMVSAIESDTVTLLVPRITYYTARWESRGLREMIDHSRIDTCNTGSTTATGAAGNHRLTAPPTTVHWHAVAWSIFMTCHRQTVLMTPPSFSRQIAELRAPSSHTHYSVSVERHPSVSHCSVISAPFTSVNNNNNDNTTTYKVP